MDTQAGEKMAIEWRFTIVAAIMVPPPPSGRKLFHVGLTQTHTLVVRVPVCINGSKQVTEMSYDCAACLTFPPLQVESPLVSRGILPPEPGWVNSVAINYYHDGSEGIQLHYDDAQRFVRPIYRWDACSRFPRVLEALTYHRVWHSMCVLVCRSLAACHDIYIYTYTLYIYV